MNMEDSVDLHMQDDDVVATTENESSQAQTSLIALAKRQEPQSRSQSQSQSQVGAAALKGAGLRRDTDVFDQHLTKRKDAPHPSKFKPLPYATAQTGLVYDVRMRFHVETIPTEQDLHPEDPRRIHAIFEALVQAGLAWSEEASGPPSNYYMGRIDARPVTEEEVCRVHTKKHWDWIQSLSSKTLDELEVELQHAPELHPIPNTASNDSVYLNPNTPYCAALSAGGAIEACRAILLGKVKNAFAVIRPPGHHAEREDVKGFCFYDNVSVATKACKAEFGERCRKVFILDWDIHHGNGIQQAHYEDPNVLYISLHVHLDGHFYPEKSYRDRRGPYGDRLHCGSGAGLGLNVNVPWRVSGMGDGDYLYAFQQLIMPIAMEFNPDLVIVSAGFDAAEGDHLGGCHITPAAYAHMTHMLMSLADGRIAVCLEGGYNLDSIARSACAVARTLMGEPPERLTNLVPTKSGIDDVKAVIRQQSKFWSCLYPKDLSAQLAGPLKGERLHDVVRKWQAATLWDEHEMTPLFIHKDKLSKTFENQVLATPNYMEAKPLLVVLHDPPDVLASPDPRTGKIELHNTWLTDIVKTYVSWAAKQGFAVIDVNLPKYITAAQVDSQAHAESDGIEYRIREATQLLTYLWDNYIDLNESTHVFLVGTNIGHGAIVNFIKQNEERAQETLTKAISFVENVPLQSCRSATSDTLAQWYYTSSLVFVSAEHSFWTSEFAQKIRKRFGHVYKSTEASVTDMLIAHQDAVTGLMSAATAEWRANKMESEESAMSENSPAALEPLQFRSPVKEFTIASQSTGIARNNTQSPGLKGRQPGTQGSPSRVPPIANFAPSQKMRLSKSPMR